MRVFPESIFGTIVREAIPICLVRVGGEAQTAVQTVPCCESWGGDPAYETIDRAHLEE